MRPDDDPLGRPRRTDVSPPNSDFIEEFTSSPRDGVLATESTVAELFVFENANLGRKLEVLVWTIEHVEDNARTALHYAFLLKVVDA